MNSYEGFFCIRGSHLQAHGAAESLRAERGRPGEPRITTYELLTVDGPTTYGLVRSRSNLLRQRLEQQGCIIQTIPPFKKDNEVRFGFALAMPRARKKRESKPRDDQEYLGQVLASHGFDIRVESCTKLRVRQIQLKSSTQTQGFNGVIVDFIAVGVVTDEERFNAFVQRGHKTLRGFGVGLPILTGSALYPFFLAPSVLSRQ